MLEKRLVPPTMFPVQQLLAATSSFVELTHADGVTPPHCDALFRVAVLHGASMAIDRPDVVDFASVDPEDGRVALTISDHLDWEYEDIHLEVLAEKLAYYVAFISTGDIYSSFPPSVGRRIKVEIMCNWPTPPHARAAIFASREARALTQAGVGLSLRMLAVND